MNKELIEKAKGLSREERMKLLMEYKKELSASDLENVSGGSNVPKGNPNSEVPDDCCNWWTSMGYTCEGRRQC